MNSTETSRLEEGLPGSKCSHYSRREHGRHPRTTVCTPGPWCDPQDHGIPPWENSALEDAAAKLCHAVLLEGRQTGNLPWPQAHRNGLLAGESLGEGTDPAVPRPRLRLKGGSACLPACWPGHTALTGSAAPVCSPGTSGQVQNFRKVQNKYEVCDRHRENNIKQGNSSSSKHDSRWQKQRECVAKGL